MGIETKRRAGTSGAGPVDRWAARRKKKGTQTPQTDSGALPPESWNTAKTLSAVIGPPNSLVCDVVRSITKASTLAKTSDPERLRSFAAQSASFLVKVSPTLGTALFFAAREYHPVALLASRPLTKRSLLSLFEGDELLSILLTTYFSRIVRKSVPQAIWNRHATRLNTHTFLAGLVGRNVAGVGLGYGILLGSLNYLSLLVQAAAMPEAFESLQEHLAGESVLFDQTEELNLFSCCHQQVAHALLTSAGFDHRLRAAFGPDIIARDTAHASESPRSEANRWKAVVTVATELQQSGSIPSSLGRKLFDPPIAEGILRIAAMVRANPDHLSSWFLKSPLDLPPDIRHALGVPHNSGDDDGLSR